MFKKIKLIHYVLILSFINLILYQFPFYKFVYNNIEVATFNAILLLVSLTITNLVLNAFIFYIGVYLLRSVGKWIIALFFTISALCIYFINTYGVMIDRSMIGNIFNTKYEEASGFFSFGLILYVVLLGILPSIFIFKIKYINDVKWKTFLKHIFFTLIFFGAVAYANAINWTWIDNNSKKLGALVMPWSFVINTNRYFIKQNEKEKKQILLGNATIKNNEKSVTVLVIGESARSSNFSLYGYNKNTNPLLSKIENIKHFKAESCATYTTAGVKCILDHKNTDESYEILPNYLFRNNVEVFWRTTNWGEPNVNIDNYQEKGELQKSCEGEDCEYDGVLLSGLKEQILSSTKNKILVILHTSTSHGPTYFKKYPKEFNQFTPVCKSVELGNCTQEELINAYDNTILYTDNILARLINDLKDLKEFKSSMIFISDHGESLGEKNLYMHGLPKSIAPDVQFEVPFIVWTSENSRKVKDNEILSQHNVFHSVLDFLDIESPVYDENMSIFE